MYFIGTSPPGVTPEEPGVTPEDPSDDQSSVNVEVIYVSVSILCGTVTVVSLAVVFACYKYKTIRNAHLPDNQLRLRSRTPSDYSSITGDSISLRGDLNPEVEAQI